jgi:hypothetical protein
VAPPARGEDAALTDTDYARAVLCNGLRDYRPAAEAAHGTSASTRSSPPGPCMSWWRPLHEAISGNVPARRLISCRS